MTTFPAVGEKILKNTGPTLISIVQVEGFVRELRVTFRDISPSYLPVYYGELFRNRYWVNNIGKSISIYDFTMDYYLSDSEKEIIPDHKAYAEYIARKFQEYGGSDGLSTTSFYSIEEIQEMYDWWIRDAHSKLINYFNFFTNSMAIYSVPRLHEIALDLPAEYKKNEKFMLKHMANACSEVFEIPFFSHCCNQRMDPRSKELKRSATLMASLISLYSNIDRRGLLKPFAKKAYVLQCMF